MARSGAVGIDFGTSYCKMVRYADGQLRPVRIGGRSSDYVLVPSVVQFPPEPGTHSPDQSAPSVVVGKTAKSSRISQGQRTWPSAVEGHQEIKLGLTDPAFPGILFEGQQYGAQQMAEEIFVYLLRGAAESLGERPSDAVVTAPAYFSRDQIEVIKQVAKDAGLIVLRHVAEPVAAAIAYSFADGLSGSVLVYDFGGGTVDIAVLEVAGHDFRVLTKTGKPAFGGTRLDKLLYERFLQPQAQRITGLDLDLHKPSPATDTRGSCNLDKQLLLDLAEKMRTELSSKDSYEASLRLQLPGHKPHTTDSGEHTPEEVECRFALGRSELDSFLGEEINATFDDVHEAAHLAGFRQVSDIDHVLLVGGVTRMPLIRQRMRELAGDKLRVPRDPDLLVAEGAALVAAHPDYEQAVAADVLARSLRGRVRGTPETAVIIERGTALDKARNTIRGTWPSPHTEEVSMPLFEGEEKDQSKNDRLGVVRIKKPAQDIPTGTAVNITVQYDVPGDTWAVTAETPDGVPLEASLDRSSTSGALGPALETVQTAKANIVLCIDVSRSFRRAHWDVVGPECLRLEQALRDAGVDCSFGLIAFSDAQVPGEEIRGFDFVEDEDALQARLEQLPACYGGDTPEDVGPALRQAADMMRSGARADASRVVCLFTDAAPKDPAEVEKAGPFLSSVRAPAYVFAPKSPYEAQYAQLAKTTKGDYIDLHRKLHEGIDRVIKTLQSQ